jgi:hypothetical protein
MAVTFDYSNWMGYDNMKSLQKFDIMSSTNILLALQLNSMDL